MVPNADTPVDESDLIQSSEADLDAKRQVTARRLPIVPLRYLLVLSVAMLCMSPDSTPQLCGTALQISSLIG